MSFLKGARVSAEPCYKNTAAETELSGSFGQEKGKRHFSNNDGKETSIIDDHGANFCEEGLNGIPEEQLYNSSALFQNGMTSRPGSLCPKRLSWEPDDLSSSKKRSQCTCNHACERMILIAVCLLSAASVALTLLMLFGVVGPLNCACPKKTGISICILCPPQHKKLYICVGQYTFNKRKKRSLLPPYYSSNFVR